MKLLNSKGFSLVEVMVAAGLIGTVSLGVMTMTQNTNKTIKTSESKSEILTIVSEMQMLVSDPDACLKI